MNGVGASLAPEFSELLGAPEANWHRAISPSKREGRSQMRNIPYDWLFFQHAVLIRPPGDHCQLLGAASATFNSQVKGPEHADNGIGHWDFQLRQVARPVIYLKKNHKRTMSHFQQPQLQRQTVNSEKPISTVGRARFLVSDRLASIRLEKADETAAGAARPQLVRGLQTLGEKRGAAWAPP